MSAWSLARPSASRVARFSSSLPPHWLQKRARRWFLQPQPEQRSVSLRLGMATNDPLVPSMIFRSRTTKASSNVTEQKACSRSLSLLPSSMSLMRTSVITTADLLFSVAHSNATPYEEQLAPHGAGPGRFPRQARRQLVREPAGLRVVAAEGEDAAAAAAHQLAGRAQPGQALPPLGHFAAQPLRRFLQAVVQVLSQFRHVPRGRRRPDLVAAFRPVRDVDAAINLRRRKARARAGQYQPETPSGRDRLHDFAAPRAPGRRQRKKERHVAA